jgi:hypothetical protein
MKRTIILAALVVFCGLSSTEATAQTTQFSHQGNLGFPANGNYDFDVKLFDTPTVGTGTQLGATHHKINYPVTNGAFTMDFLDFGTWVFTGNELFLEISYRVTGGGAFTILSPRERMTAVYANRSLSAATADNATQLGGLPPSGFIQNTTQQQTGGFNVAGDVAAAGTLAGGIVNAATQFNLGGSRVLSVSSSNNTFLGWGAGASNTTGSGNSFFGNNAAASNTFGINNSIFGLEAGFANLGSNNSIFGAQAGRASSGNGNSFFGVNAGFFNSTGSNNVFSGLGAGSANTTGSANTIVGFNANITPSNLSNATAIGANALVGQSNSLVLGSINGINGATAHTRVGIGITTPSFKLHVIDASNTGLRVQTNMTGGTVASFGGNGAFQIDANGIVGGRLTVTENGNVGIGTASPMDKLVVSGGFFRLNLPAAGGSSTLCLNTSNQIAFCSSSLRYKTDIAPFAGGLSLVNRLQPITFTWKADGKADLGLGAEDVARIEPLLVTHNEKGEVEGVKYDRVAVVLLNAVKEQQAQIKHQAEQIHSQQQQIEVLRRLLCLRQPKADNCRSRARQVAASN